MLVLYSLLVIFAGLRWEYVELFATFKMQRAYSKCIYNCLHEKEKYLPVKSKVIMIG